METLESRVDDMMAQRAAFRARLPELFKVASETIQASNPDPTTLAEAHYRLYLFHTYGWADATQDKNLALEFLKKAMALNHPPALADFQRLQVEKWRAQVLGNEGDIRRAIQYFLNNFSREPATARELQDVMDEFRKQEIIDTANTATSFF